MHATAIRAVGMIVQFLLVASVQGSCPEIISRDQWGAKPQKKMVPIQHPIPHVFIHHTESKQCATREDCTRTVRIVEDYCIRERGFDGIGYSFLIGGNGEIYEGRGWDRVGAQVKNWNSKSVGISFIGNFMRTKPTDAALKAAQDLIECGVSQGKLSGSYKLHGHRDAANTDCPGDPIYQIINNWPHYQKQV